MWSDVPLIEDSDRWAELTENGWGALIGWAAGAKNLGRRRGSDDGRTVTVSCEWDGTTTTSVEPFTAHDRMIVEDSIGEYLAEAGVPPRPQGWVWLIRVPDSYASGQDFLDRINAELYATQPAPVRPSEWLPVMQKTMGRLYGRV